MWNISFTIDLILLTACDKYFISIFTLINAFVLNLAKSFVFGRFKQIHIGYPVFTTTHSLTISIDNPALNDTLLAWH